LAYEERDVVLASGRTSRFYVDCRRVSFHPEGAVLCGQALYRAWKDSGAAAVAVGGPALGAVPLVTAFAYTAWLAGEAIQPFAVRKEPKTHGAGQQIEGADSLHTGSPVLLLEDVVTSGGSTCRAIAACRAAGLEPSLVLALVDRDEGGRAAIADEGVELRALFVLDDLRARQERPT
jgi:orotate phosphoribosyltransferase